MPTRIQHEYLIVIKKFLKSGRQPTYREISEAMERSTKQSAHNMVKRLEELGFVKRGSNGRVSSVQWQGAE